MFVVQRAQWFGAELRQASGCAPDACADNGFLPSPAAELQSCVDAGNCIDTTGDPRASNPVVDFAALACCPPSATVILNLDKMIQQGRGNLSYRALTGSPAVLKALAAHASANPDTAVVTAVKAIDAILEHVNLNGAADDDKTAVDEATKVLATNIPKATSASAARGILKLKDLSDLASQREMAASAAKALAALPKPTTPTSTTPTPAAPTTKFQLSTRAKTALWVTGAVAAVGGSAFLLWRTTRVPSPRAHAIAARRRRR